LLVKEGIPSEEVLEGLCQHIGESWKPLGRRLRFSQAEINGFDRQNEVFTEKPYQMLLHWKHRDGEDATYQVLYDALCHDFVKERALAEQFCCD